MVKTVNFMSCEFYLTLKKNRLQKWGEHERRWFSYEATAVEQESNDGGLD